MKTPAQKTKIAVAMSGGVDSSVTALLLQKKGYDVIGVHMKLGTGEHEQSAEAAARRVCSALGIKFYPLNISRKFKQEVVDYFLESYQKGLTPNPCVRCNRQIKFGELLGRAKELGADKLATGHYITHHASRNTQQAARNTQHTTRNTKQRDMEYEIFKAKDANKDQTYFLWHLTQSKLKNILFPLGDFLKDDIRRIADEAGLPYIKSESQDICFLPGDHNDFLRARLKLAPGDIVLIDNNPVGTKNFWSLRESRLIGRHQGLPLYTIGQRRGVEIGGRGPYYVAGFDYKKNILYVVNSADHPALFKNKCDVREVNWISGSAPAFPYSCSAVIRYRHKPVKCRLSKTGNKLTAEFIKPQRAVTPGQSIVFYQNRRMLGGGVIA